MKKAITILAILAIVLASAVFAAETHQITVRADVTEVPPAFNLHFGALDTNETATDVYGKTPAVNYNEISHTENGSADVGFTLDVANSFTVTAQVINNVKTNKSFTIQFKGGVFGVNRDGDTDLYYSPSQITVRDVHTTDAVKTTNGVTDLTNSTQNADSTADTSETLIASGTVNFSGKTGDTSTAALNIISATFTYPGDTTIDPTLNGAHYYADIVMIVTAGV